MTATRRSIGRRERLAIFQRWDGVCHVCGGKIDGTRERWEVEHVIARGLGGDEAKGSPNLRPVHAEGSGCHKTKTADDVAKIAKAKRAEARHLGATRPRNPLPWSRGSPFKRKLDGRTVRRDGD